MFGKTVTGIVRGYRNDNVLYNGVPGAVAEIIVSAKDGKRLLLYQLGSPAKILKVGSVVPVKIHKNIFKVLKNRDTDDVYI